jgi:hypothetical protein
MRRRRSRNMTTTDPRPPSEVELKYALEIYGNCDLLTRIINEVSLLRAQQSTVVTVSGVTYNLPKEAVNELLENEIRRLRELCGEVAEAVFVHGDSPISSPTLYKRLDKAAKGEI